MRPLLILACLLLAPASATAVELPFDAVAELGDLDPALVPSGILMDRALPLLDWSAWSGRGDSRNLSARDWRQLIHEAARAGAAVDPAWIARSRTVPPGRPIPLAVIDLGYQELTPPAVGATGWHLSARTLRSDRLFAAAALRDRTFQGQHTQFVLSSDWALTDRPRPAAVQVDFDDGRGFRAVAWDQPVAVSYQDVGRHTLRLRVEGREAQLGFRVMALSTPAPDDTLGVTATLPHQGQFGAGEAFVYLAPGHATLTRPAVVVEGFDLDNSMNWDELYALLNDENLLEDLRAEGFDAVVLNFDEATAPIQENAMVLVELLQTIAALTGSTSLPLTGASMGGLVCRYALAYMESQVLPHFVDTYVSFDTPHGGANIPLGIQYWLSFFQDLSAEAEFLLSRLDTPASRQMLLYHHASSPGPSGHPDPLRTQYLADLAAVGGFPQQPRTVAVANGSGSRQDQGFSPGDQIIRYEYDTLLADITGNVWAVPDGAPTTGVFDGLIWVFLVSNLSQTVSVDGTLPLDAAPGGWRSSMAQMDSTEAPFGDIVALHDNHCFIPTISALALDVVDPFYDVLGDPNLLDHSPFDALYVPLLNQGHVDVTAENRAWLVNEIVGPTVAVPSRATAATLSLLPSVPNPFNPQTTLRFQLDAAGVVTLEVFDPRGRLVDRLMDRRRLGSGVHRVPWAPRDLASGVYHYRVTTPHDLRVGRVVLLK